MNEHHYSDLQLIERFRQGDQVAFDLLVHRYEKIVYRYAYRLTQNPEDAAEVASETFVRMYRSLKNFRGEASLSTWLYRIVNNAFFDWRKRTPSRPTTSLEIYLEEEATHLERPLVNPTVDLEEHVLQQERWRVLEEAIAKLPDYQRIMIVMFHLEDRSYEEIAKTMNLPLGTVKSRLNRARQALKELLKPHLELFGLEGSLMDSEVGETDAVPSNPEVIE